MISRFVINHVKVYKYIMPVITSNMYIVIINVKKWLPTRQKESKVKDKKVVFYTETGYTTLEYTTYE